MQRCLGRPASLKNSLTQESGMLFINSKDLSKPKLRKGTAVQGYATFNDDIQATAAVTLGSLYGAQRQEGVPRMADQTFLFFGAGQANIGAAQLLTLALAQNGLSAAEARSQIWLMDSQVKPLHTLTVQNDA